MAEGTYMWMQVAHFAIDAEEDDLALIAELIRTPEYAYDYASPFETRAAVFEPTVHERWWRDRISPDLFERCSSDDAERVIESWADNQDFTQPSAVQQRLHDVFSLLRLGSVYRLVNPDALSEHDYGWVTGFGGFHDFVVISREDRTINLIVATDD